MPRRAGENITVIFVNNAIYGMTGGQMAPTTLPGQVTQTSPYGRDVATVGYPVKVCEMLSQVDGAAYLERVAVNSVKHINQAKKAIEKAFRNQVEGKGFSLIEVLSTCPTNWGMTPDQAMQWVEEKMIPYYPLGVYKDRIRRGGGRNEDMSDPLCRVSAGRVSCLLENSWPTRACLTGKASLVGCRPTARKCAAARPTAASSSAMRPSARRSSTGPMCWLS